jgi:hypothetical protein
VRGPRGGRGAGPKTLVKELKEDKQLVLELIVAEKLGYTLNELRERMVPEELSLWAVFYDLRNQEEQAAINKAKTRRR